MFNSTGVLPLSKGTNVYMTPEAEVKYYSSGYLEGNSCPARVKYYVW